jgi:hypothetical protein
MGQVYYDMGFLSSDEVIECSASDLVGQYVGQTGPKTKKLFEKALGRVLFIDEAYRLGEGLFAQEAMDEIVGILTHERYKSKMVVILAGYDQEMNKLMSVNPGLSSRFPEEIVLQNFPPVQCLDILKRELKKANVRLYDLEDPSSLEYQKMVALVEDLSTLPSWGNARDIITLSKTLIRHAIKTQKGRPSDTELTLTGKDAVVALETLLLDKRERCSNLPTNSRPKSEGVTQMINPLSAMPPSMSTAQTTQSAVPKANRKAEEEAEPGKGTVPPQQIDGRDDGVTDAIWLQLQADKEAAELASKESERALREMEQAAQEAADRERAQQVLRRLEEARARDAAEQAEHKRKLEEARRRELAAKMERERIAALLKARREEEERKKQREAKVQQALRNMGVCCAGFAWIKQQGGYRCAGGSHFVSDGQLPG